MRPFRSSQNQCCCCVVAILLSLGSVILTGIGVCVILKYVMIRMDLLLPELQNHDGQKIVGIILTSVGVLGIIISAIVAILYFTVCHESRGAPAVAQKICKNGISEGPNSPATPKIQANGQNKFHNSSHLTPKSPTKMQPSKPNSLFDNERMNSAKPIYTIGGVPLTSTPRKIRGGKNGRPLSSNLDIVEEVDSDVPVPQLQVNGIDVSLLNGCNCVDNVVHMGQKSDIALRSILKTSSNTTTTTTTTTAAATTTTAAATTTTAAATTTTTIITTATNNNNNYITSTDSIAAAAATAVTAATCDTTSVSRCLFPLGNVHNNNNSTTTTVTSVLSGSHTSSVYSKPHHDTTTNTTTITELDQSICDPDQDTECEETSSRL